MCTYALVLIQKKKYVLVLSQELRPPVVFFNVGMHVQFAIQLRSMSCDLCCLCFNKQYYIP